MFGSVERWCQLTDDEKTGAPLADALAKLGRGRDLDVAGQGLKRVPKPYPEDHPRAELFKHKRVQARWPEATPTQLYSATSVDWVAERLSACARIHH